MLTQDEKARLEEIRERNAAWTKRGKLSDRDSVLVEEHRDYAPIEIPFLLSLIDRLVKDGERLDWLEQNADSIATGPIWADENRGGDIEIGGEYLWQDWYDRPIREAIDAARKEETP